MLDDGREREFARELYLAQLYLADYVECVLHLRGRPSRTKIDLLHRRWFEYGTPIAIDIDTVHLTSAED